MTWVRKRAEWRTRPARSGGGPVLYPTVDGGVKGVAFIAAAVRLSVAGGVGGQAQVV